MPYPSISPQGQGYHAVADESFDRSAASKTMSASDPPSYFTSDDVPLDILSSYDQPAASQSEPPARDPLVNPGKGRVRWGETSTEPRSTRIRVRTDGNGPTITISQPETPTAPHGAAVAPMSPVRQEHTGLQRANRPGHINLDDLKPKFEPMTQPHVVSHGDGDIGHTGMHQLEDDDNNRLAALAHELDGLDSEAASERPPPGQVIIRDEAFLPGLATAPRSEGSQDHEPLQGGTHSGTTTPGTESDYDPAEYLEYVDIIPGETDGMPSVPRKSRRKRAQESTSRGWSRLRGIIGVPNKDENIDDLAEKGALGADATNQKSVPVLTSSGLRGTGSRHRPSALERKAAKLVRAHKLLNGLPTSDEEIEKLDQIPSINREHLPPSDASTPDALETAEQLDARPVASSGVLGQLLKLYDQEREGADSASHSETAPLAPPSETEQATSLGGGLNLIGDQVVDAYGNQAAVKDVHPEVLEAAVARKGMGTPTHGPVSPRRSSLYSGSGLINLANHNIATVGNVSQTVMKHVANDVGIDVMDERPKAARSAAGTIGALVATTGNLIGAVSPLHAQLGPNPRRPGYTLDRYLLPEINEKTLRRTAKIVAEAAPVPKRLREARTPGGSLMTPTYLSTVTPGDSSYNPYFGEAKSITGQSTGSSKRSADILTQSGSALGSAGRNLLHKQKPSISVSEDGMEYIDGKSAVEVAKKEWQKKLRKRKAKTKKQEIFITMHVAAILKRQEFLMKLSRALMMFGAPTHRIELQIQQTANVLEVNCRCIYFPNLMILSFGDDTTHTSETKIIKQGSVVDLTKLTDMHTIYWNVIHDKIGVEQGSKQLDALMRRKPIMRKWHHVIVGGLASAFICVGQWGFSGSFLDATAAFVLGAFMIFCQESVTSEVYSNVFEIVFATINSFISMALHQIGSEVIDGERVYGRYFCYQAVAAGSIVLILPGFIVLTGALELQSKNIVAGSVRLVYAIIYSVLLGLGIMIGALPLIKGDDDQGRAQCGARNHAQLMHWYNTMPGGKGKASFAWAFLTVPGYATLLSLRNQAKVTRKEFPTMVLIAISGWLVSNFAVIADNVTTGSNPVPSVLSQHPYLFSAMGSFTVGALANIYGRLFDGRSFVVAVPGILYQLPSGMTGGTAASPTFLSFATLAANSTGDSKTKEVTSGFQIGAQLLNVSLGIAIGLFASTLLMYFLGGRKVRGGGMFSF
ncbi:pheromone-regulated protein Prm10 [Malassezia pachydermatis]